MDAKTMRGALLTVAASFLFGAIPALTLNAYTGGITVLTMQSLKYLMVTLLLVPYAVTVHRIHKLPPRLILKLLLTSGLLYATQAALYAYAVTLIPVSLAALLLFLYPILVSLISVAFGVERLSCQSTVALATAAVGMVVMFSGGVEAVSWIGVACSVLAALAYGVYVILINRLTKDLPPPVTNTFANMGPAVTLTVLALATGSFSLQFTPQTWWYVLFNAVCGGILAYIMWFMGLKALGAVRTSVISMTEPVFAALVSFLLLGQRMTVQEIAGGLVLLIGVTFFTQFQKNERSC